MLTVHEAPAAKAPVQELLPIENSDGLVPVIANPEGVSVDGPLFVIVTLRVIGLPAALMNCSALVETVRER
jgi:hypothetical protein